MEKMRIFDKVFLYAGHELDRLQNLMGSTLDKSSQLFFFHEDPTSSNSANKQTDKRTVINLIPPRQR